MTKRRLALWLLAAAWLLGGAAAEGSPLTGTVVRKDDGQPLPGASLWVVTGPWNVHAPPSPFATSGADGSFVVPEPPAGPFMLYVCATGFLPWAEAFRSAGEPLAVSLEPAATLRGRVLGPEGQPLAGVSVQPDRRRHLTSWKPPHPCAVPTKTTTDDQGRFSLEPLEPGEYSLWALTPDRQEGGIGEVEAPAGTIVEGLEIQVERDGFAHATQDEELKLGERREVEVRLQPAGTLATSEDHTSPPPGAARELSGRVLDPGGTPLAEAIVTVNPDEGDTVSSALVEDDGSYLVSPAPPGPFTLTIGAAGYESVEHRIETGSDDVRIEAVLARENKKECRSRPPAPAEGPGAILTGRVHGPLPADREILVLLQGQDTVRHQALAADATFRWDDVPSGAWEVVADAGPGRIAGRALTIKPWQSESSAEIEVDLEIPAAPPAALPSPDRASAEVRVVDRSGRPLSGATVHAGSAARLRQEARTRATTAGGMVRLDGLPPYESLWLLIERKGFVPEVRDLTLQPGEHRALQVTLLPGVSAAGQVVDEAGRPVPGAEVELAGDVLGPELPADASDFLSGRATLRTRTGRAGRFRFDDLPEGDYEIHLRHPSYAQVHAVYAVDGNDLGQLALRRGTAGPDRREPPDMKPEATVRGRVVDPSGHPVAGAVLRPKPASSDPWDLLDTGLAEIQGYSLKAVTDAAGRFSLGLLPGWYRLEARADGWKSSRSGTLRAAAGQTIDGIEIRLQRGAVVFGRVLDAAGAPIAGARVQSGSAETASQADGSFRFDGLPFGPATLKIENSVSWLHRFEPLSREIELTSGATRVDLVLLENPQCGCIPVPVRGRVLGPDGAPVAEARVALFRGGRTWSAADGSFEIPVPAHWEVEIQAHKRGFADGWVQLNAGGAPVEGLEIRLTSGTLVTGRVLGLASATPDPADQVDLRPLQPETGPWFDAPLHADGTFRLRHAPPGSWELSTEISERKAATALTLTPGPAEIQTDLQLPAVHPVSGRVSNELGRPLAGMGITAWWESSGHGITSTETNADGLFTLDLPDGEYGLQVRNDGYQEDWLELQVQGAPIAGLDFRLERATLLHGRLLGLAPTEKPVIRAELVPGSPGQLSLQRSAGLDTYAIPDLHPGLWRIEASTPTCTLRRTIEVLPGATEIEMDLDFAEAQVEAEETEEEP